MTAYAEAVINSRHTILGRRLDPLCLAHAEILGLSGNPLAPLDAPSRQPTAPDLIEALVVCSTPYDALYAYDLTPRGILAAWRHHRWLRAVTRHLTPASVRDIPRADAARAQALAAWQTYVADHYTRPDYWDGEAREGTPLATPYILAVTAYLEQHTNRTEQQIKTAPLGKIIWLHAAIAEFNGHSTRDLMSDEDLAILAEAAEAEKEAARV